MADVVLSLGGEGEQPGEVNINLLRDSHGEPMTLRTPPFPLLVQADVNKGLPIRPGFVDRVVARRFPVYGSVTRLDVIASESLRVLRPGGVAELGRSNGPAAEIAAALSAAGFHSVTLTGQVAKGTAP